MVCSILDHFSVSVNSKIVFVFEMTPSPHDTPHLTILAELSRYLNKNALQRFVATFSQKLGWLE